MKKQTASVVDQKKLVDFITKLITVPSVTSDLDSCSQVLEVVKEELKGLKYKEYKSNGVKSLLFYNTPTIPKKFRVLLNAHLDVVAAHKESFSPKVKGGKLYARGAQDMKSGGGALILAYKNLAHKVSYPLGLQLVTDEEVGGTNGVAYQIKKGVDTEFILAGESTNLKINNEAKGITWLKIKTVGVEAHGAYPWRGKNALDILRNVLNDLRKAYPEQTKEVWKTTMNISKIDTSNVTHNKVPDNAYALLDFRTIHKDHPVILKKLESIIANRAQIEIIEHQKTQYTTPEHTDIKLLIKVMNDHEIEKAEFQQTHGGSDVRYYTDRGRGAICFGPTGYGLHTSDEWVDIKSIHRYCDIISKFLQSVE